jgi:hypothetical protein
MMSLNEYIKKFDEFQKSLPEMLMAEVVGTVGADIRATVANRVITTGNKGSGGRFTPYKPKKDGSMGSYAELRRLKGLQVIYKDFSFSGGMWRSFNVVDSELYKTGFKVRFGGTGDPINQNIINWQSEREKESIIDMTNLETEALGKRIDKIVLRKFKEFGL